MLNGGGGCSDECANHCSVSVANVILACWLIFLISCIRPKYFFNRKKLMFQLLYHYLNE